jgi:hypothetical protein
MSENVHPLQEYTVHLIDALYKDRHLAVTPAMLSIQNGHYPSVQAILETLHRYENEDLVTSFIGNNSELVAETRAQFSHKQAQNESSESVQDERQSLDDIFGSTFETIKPFELLKGIRLSEIEKGFSEVLTQLCGEDLSVRIDGLEEPDSWHEQVNLKLGIVATREIR